MKRIQNIQSKLVLCVLLFFAHGFIIHAQESKVKIDGALKKWHKVTLSFEGDALSENDANNPFLNYRLNVIFKHKDRIIKVPGFFAADGNAAETSATSGNVWQVRFMPDATGEWEFEAFFRKGKNIAISDALHAGESTGFDGVKGKFVIEDADKTGASFRTKGRLKYDGTRYLKYTDTNEPFLKGGADSPENFLGYYEFDQTPPSHKYDAHAKDWNTGDPTWQDGKGKNIIGALNYLASKGMNSVYFLTMNVQGDGKDVWPWIHEHERYRFDTSKLDQWEVVFDHMDQLGLMLHIVTQETENELLLDIGELKTQRKLYYRELIARFSHHLGITWNLGEENGWQSWSPKAQSDADRKAMAQYIKTQDPNKSLVVLHTHSQIPAQNHFLNPLLGNPNLDGASMQIHHPHDVHDITVKWIQESADYGKQWVVCQDEIGPAHTGAKPDADDPNHDAIRHEVLWGNLMAGGAGVEWYFGYKYAHNDLNCEDWRSREILWDQTRYALEFFQNHVPFQDMQALDAATDNKTDFVLADPGISYVIYLPEVQKTKLDLTQYPSQFSVKWYNPKVGGYLQQGSLKTIKGGKVVSIGNPPNKKGDWVALIVNTSENQIKTISDEAPLTLKALEDFTAVTNRGTTYYKEGKKGTFAINASKVENRTGFASAYTIFKGETGMYKAVLNTVAEHDGESEYRIKINKNKVKAAHNSMVRASFKKVKLSLGVLYLKTNDTIEVSSNAYTNGILPENDGTAWSRGRWSGLSLTKSHLLQDKGLQNALAFTFENNILKVEAEDYHLSSNNASPRKWYIRDTEHDTAPFLNIENHAETASEKSYIEVLPDTRVTHKDVLIQGENFFPLPGTGAVVAYKVNIKTPGKYRVWVRAYSTGSEDNGLHVGLDGQWPESGQRIQLCKGKHKWTWSSAQRVPENHCGQPGTIYLDIKEAGEHIITFSMREDGFEFDAFILTSDLEFIPQ